MTERDRPRFAAAMVKMAASVKGATLTQPLQDAFWEEFSDTPIEQFIRACDRARRELDFLPSLREMRSFVGPRRELPDPALVKLLTPWAPKEPWPQERVAQRRRPPAEPEPLTEMERAIQARMLAMAEVKKDGV